MKGKIHDEGILKAIANGMEIDLEKEEKPETFNDEDVIDI